MEELKNKLRVGDVKIRSWVSIKKSHLLKYEVLSMPKLVRFRSMNAHDSQEKVQNAR